VNTVLLSFLLVCNVLLLVVCLSLVRRLRVWEYKISDTFREWITAPDEKTPSPLALFISQIGAVVGGQCGNSVMAAIRGALGGTQKGANAEAMAEAVEGDSKLGLVQALAPKLFRRLNKNPAALAGLQGVLGKLFGGAAGDGASSSRSSGGIRRHRYE